MDTRQKTTRKDFMSDQEVRWCPGCGDYAILAALQRTLPELGTPREATVFISGIGCSSRFPYYMNTYGFHTIHGRAPAFATGLKLSNPDLDVWLITGDGDAFSIGGNHVLHVLRRNVDLNILLFNNRVYGLTKGQYSPTSLVGQLGPSTPMGSVDAPVSPCLFALGANARFVARGIDTVQKPLIELFKRSHAHKGASFLEILQNCPVFNDKEFEGVTSREFAADNQLWVEHGQPLVFGKEKNRGLRLKPGSLTLEVVTRGENGATKADLLIHDETDRTQAFLLAQIQPPNFPMAFGVLYNNPAPESYDRAVAAQNTLARERKGVGDLNALLRGGHTWTIKS